MALTLKEKKLISYHVTEETKRCIEILTKHKDEDIKFLVNKIINGSKYLEFFPELKERTMK